MSDGETENHEISQKPEQEGRRRLGPRRSRGKTASYRWRQQRRRGSSKTWRHGHGHEQHREDVIRAGALERPPEKQERQRKEAHRGFVGRSSHTISIDA